MCEGCCLEFAHTSSLFSVFITLDMLHPYLILDTPAEVWYSWKETLVVYVNLLPFVNKVSVPEAIDVKLLRFCLGEHG